MDNLRVLKFRHNPFMFPPANVYNRVETVHEDEDVQEALVTSHIKAYLNVARPRHSSTDADSPESFHSLVQPDPYDNERLSAEITRVATTYERLVFKDLDVGRRTVTVVLNNILLDDAIDSLEVVLIFPEEYPISVTPGVSLNGSPFVKAYVQSGKADALLAELNSISLDYCGQNEECLEALVIYLENFAGSHSKYAPKVQQPTTEAHGTWNQQQLEDAYSTITRLVQRLGFLEAVFDDAIIISAQTILKQASESNLFDIKSRDVLIAGCILMACRGNEVVCSLAEIYNDTGINEKEDSRTFKRLEDFLQKQSIDTASGSSEESTYQGKDDSAQLQQQVAQIEKSVTHLLVATKELLGRLTLWSHGKTTKSEVSDVYVRLGYGFNVACRAFNDMGIDTSEFGPVSDLLRSMLEEMLSEKASESSLERYLPRIRDIIIKLLQDMKTKHKELRQKSKRDQLKEHLVGEEDNQSIPYTLDRVAHEIASSFAGEKQMPEPTLTDEFDRSRSPLTEEPPQTHTGLSPENTEGCLMTNESDTWICCQCHALNSIIAAPPCLVCSHPRCSGSQTRNGSASSLSPLSLSSTNEDVLSDEPLPTSLAMGGPSKPKLADQGDEMVLECTSIGEPDHALVPASLNVFQKGDKVAAVTIVEGQRQEARVRVSGVRLSDNKTWEYQLISHDGTLYADGRWYKERELAMDKDLHKDGHKADSSFFDEPSDDFPTSAVTGILDSNPNVTNPVTNPSSMHNDTKAVRYRCHIRYHLPSDQGPYQCQVCNQGFVDEKDFHRHCSSRSHSDRAQIKEPMFLCHYPECDYAGTYRKDNLERHLRLVHGEKEEDNEPTRVAATPKIEYSKELK